MQLINHGSQLFKYRWFSVSQSGTLKSRNSYYLKGNSLTEKQLLFLLITYTQLACRSCGNQCYIDMNIEVKIFLGFLTVVYGRKGFHLFLFMHTKCSMKCLGVGCLHCLFSWIEVGWLASRLQVSLKTVKTQRQQAFNQKGKLVLPVTQSSPSSTLASTCQESNPRLSTDVQRGQGYSNSNLDSQLQIKLLDA